MGTYIIRRLIFSLVVIWIVTILSFLLVHIMAGDPAAIMLGAEASQEQIDALRHELFLDQPLISQYGHWLKNILTGDLGTSLKYQDRVSVLIAQRLPITLYLSLLALVISIVIGIAAGIYCAVRRGSVLDSTITILVNTGISLPTFLLGIIGIYLFGLKLGWLPIQGYTSPLTDFGLSLRKMIMPVICLAIPSIAVLARQTRSSMLEVVRQDYIKTAWSKGLAERVIVIKHALKNALIPIVTLIGLQLRIVVSGSVVVETVFNIPGMGRLLVTATFAKDFISVQAITLVIGIVVLLSNLIVDISYGWLDPRIRFD
ncbi:MAG: ABC transporter permease [Dehalococcoidia bacterium]